MMVTDQPVYEGPQTQSHTRQLTKANTLRDRMFDIQMDEVCNDGIDIIDMSEKSEETIRDLILQFWYQQAFSVYMVCCDLAEAGTHFINC